MTTTTNAVVIPDKLIKPHGNTAHVYIPKKYLGKRATVIIHLDDEKRGKMENNIKIFGMKEAICLTLPNS